MFDWVMQDIAQPEISEILTQRVFKKEKQRKDRLRHVVAQQIKRRICKRKMKLFIDSLCSCSPTNRGDVTDFSVTKNFQVSFSE